MMTLRSSFLCVLSFLLLICVSVLADDTKICPVRIHDPNVLWADGSWHGIQAVSDGYVYLGLSTHALEHSAALIRYEPETARFSGIGDMGKVTDTPIGTEGFVPQGKIHTPLFEHEKKLYFATHLAVVSPNVAALRKPYPGGKFVLYDMTTKAFRVLGSHEEGIVTMNADFKRGKLYALTWPNSRFLICDIATGKVENVGTTEALPAPENIFLRHVCRYLAIDPETGRVYGSRPDGTIYFYDPDVRKIEIAGVNVKDGIAGPTSESNLSNSNWRTIRYDTNRRCFYGVHAGTTSLFEFDPRAMKVKPVTRLSPLSRHNSEKFHDTSRLAFVLSKDRVIYHLTFDDALKVAGRETPSYQCRLVSYDLKTGSFRDHGLLYANGRRVFHCDSLAIGEDGKLWALAFVETTDPLKIWQLEHGARGTGSWYNFDNKLPFEMSLIEIPGDVL